jgi:hypothetical protein
MDLQLMLRILWRFRVLVGLGLIAAVGLSGPSLFKINLGRLHDHRRGGREKPAPIRSRSTCGAYGAV